MSTLLVLRMIEERHHRDDEGRPIREGRTPREHLRDGEIEYRACPYHGGRAGRPMNVSALRQTSAHWDEIVDALAALRRAHDLASACHGPDPLRVWRVSQLGSALPWFFLLRGEPVPAYAAALAKATLGTAILAQRIAVRTVAEGWLPPPTTPPSIAELAEVSGTLLGQTEVCAASEKMIERFAAALVDAPPTGAAPGFAAIAVDAARFGAHYAALKHWLWIYFLARRFLAHDLGATSLLELPSEPPDSFPIEPDDPAALPPAHRAYWFDRLARLNRPILPDGADGRVFDLGLELAAAMGAGDPPRATFARLDALHAEVVAVTEQAVRRVLGVAPFEGAITAGDRDRLLGGAPRAALGPDAGP